MQVIRRRAGSSGRTRCPRDELTQSTLTHERIRVTRTSGSARTRCRAWPRDRLEALLPDRLPAAVADAVRAVLELLERPFDVAQRDRDRVRRPDLVEAFDRLRGAVADPLAERDRRHRIAGHRRERANSPGVPPRSSSARIASGVVGHQTPSRSGSPPAASTWPLPSDASNTSGRPSRAVIRAP